jgi:hypothetical protein
MRSIILLTLALAGMCAHAATTVTGTLTRPSGGFISGCTVYVTANSTWTNADNTVTLVGQVSTARTNSSGVFSISVYPNDATTPANTSYRARYSCGLSEETWSVPTSGSPVNVSSVIAVTTPAILYTVNPLTTRGDLIYRSSTGTTRLAIGSNGTCLRSDGTDAAWGACGTGLTSLGGLTGGTQTFAKVDDTNVTLTIGSASTTHTFTLGWTGALAKARQHAATAYTDAGNTWSTGAQDFGAATSLKIPVSAGLTTSTNGLVGYDSTAHYIHAAINSVDKILVHRATSAPTNGNCAQWGANGQLGEAAAACGAGGAPGGSSGQIQYNNAGAFGGLTIGNGLQNSGGNLQADGSVVALLNAAATFSNSVDVTTGPFYKKLSIDSVGSDIASATTIAPDSPVHKVTGTTTTTTITVPASCAATNKGCTITFIPTAAWPLNTGGNIAKAVTATANVPLVLTYSHALTAWYPLTDTGGTTTPTTIVSVPATCRADGTCDSIWGTWSTSGSAADALNNTTQNIPAMKFNAGAPADGYALIPFTVPNNYTSGNVSVRINYVTAFGGSDVWKFSTLCPTGDEALARSWTAEQTVNETSSTPTTTFWGGDFSLAALTLDATCTAGVSGYIRLHRTDSATGNRWVLSALITFP